MLDSKAFAEPESLWNVPIIDASLTGVAYPNCLLIIITRAMTSAPRKDDGSDAPRDRAISFRRC